MDIIRSNYSTLGPFAQREAPSSLEYPYTDILATYLGDTSPSDSHNHEESLVDNLAENMTSVHQPSRSFLRLIRRFSADYFDGDPDKKIASDLADRWVSFARTGTPNSAATTESKWNPWHYLFDDEIEVEDDRLWQLEDFDTVFDLARFGRENNQTVKTNVNRTIEGDLWSDDAEVRSYRRRALHVLGMEVVEEDDYQTLLRRVDSSKETKNGQDRMQSDDSTNKVPPMDRTLRENVRKLQRIAQDMGFLGTGLLGDPKQRTTPQWDHWRDAFFPEVFEFQWPPEGKLVERDCTCDMWDRIRYRY